MNGSRSVRLLESAVRRVRQSDPLRAVTIVVPSHLLGQWLAPRLFASTGHLAIDFALLPDLAWRIASPRLLASGRGRVPENVDLALLLGAAAEAVEPETPEYLRKAVAMRGFGAAALRTLRDLEAAEVTPEALETIPAVDPQRLRLLARLARGLARRLRDAALVDRAGLYQEAARALPSAAVGGVVLCDMGEAPSAALGFLEALARKHRLAAVELRHAPGAPRHARRAKQAAARLGCAPDGESAPKTTTSLARLQARLFDTSGGGVRQGAPEAGSSSDLDGSLGVLAAAGEGLEAVEIARRIRHAVSTGIRAAEIAVFLHDTRTYAAQLGSALERAGIDAFFFEGVPRVDPAARALGLLLDLVGGDLERRAVMEFLTTAQVSWSSILEKDARISPARWDRLSAEAGIVSGLASWRERLAARRADVEARKWDDDVVQVDTLLRVVERLAADVGAFPASGGWQEYLDATLHLLEAWVRRAGLTKERLERVLGPLSGRAPAPSREQFLARVRELIATQTYREGLLADERVLIAPIALARGLSYRLVFVPGLVERSFPAPARPDPLLLDEEREALAGALLTTSDAVEEQRLLFADAVNAARERLVLSFPRFETSSGRVRFPSSFLLEAVQAATGRRFTAEQLLQLAQAGETGLGRAYPRDADAAIDRIERDLALVASGQPGAAAHLVAEPGIVARAQALDAAEGQPRLTAYDGVVDVAASGELLERVLLAGSRTSASSVQDFAHCPYRHLLSRGFKLREWEEPDHVYQLEPKDWGHLYHAVAARLFEWLRDNGLLPLQRETLPDAGAQLRRILEEEAQAIVDRGEVLNAALLAPARGRTLLELSELLEREAAAEPDGFVPAAFEQAYEGLAVEIAPGASVVFNGRLDRVDLKASPPTVRVVDYKTGKIDWKDGDAFQGGRRLQLAVYNEAVALLFPNAKVAEARYYHATAKGRFATMACPATEETAATLRQVLKALDETARAGIFAPVADSCQYCTFELICGKRREQRAARKKADPRLATFLAIRELP